MSERNGQKMGKAMSLSLLLLFFVPVSWAQETPQYEVFVGPSYSREEVTNSKFKNGIGWHASLDGTANNWLSAVFDFSGYYSSPKITLAGLSASVPIDSSNYLYLFGPRFTYRKFQRLTPFAEGLVGVANFRFTASSVGVTNSISSTTFAGAFGGGADYTVNSWLAIRLIEADYVVTRFREITVDPTTGQVGFSGQHRTQNNARASAGIVIRFGRR
jgi:opacity protein-like surface antigen